MNFLNENGDIKLVFFESGEGGNGCFNGNFVICLDKFRI